MSIADTKMTAPIDRSMGRTPGSPASPRRPKMMRHHTAMLPMSVVLYKRILLLGHFTLWSLLPILLGSLSDACRYVLMCSLSGSSKLFITMKVWSSSGR